MSIALLVDSSNWIFYIVATIVICAGVVCAVEIFSSMFDRIFD